MKRKEKNVLKIILFEKERTEMQQRNEDFIAFALRFDISETDDTRLTRVWLVSPHNPIKIKGKESEEKREWVEDG